MNYRWLIFAYLALFVFGVCDNTRGPVFPELISHFQISHSLAAWFFGVTSGTSIVSSALVPWAIRRWGHEAVLRYSLFFMAASQLIFASSTQFSGMLLGAFLFGVGAGGVGVVQNVMVLLAAPASHHQKLQSGLHACYGAASILSPILVMALTGLQWGWQSVFWVSGFMVLGLALFTYRGKSAFVASTPPSKNGALRFWSVEEIFFAFILGFYVAVELLISTRTASFLRHNLGIGLSESSFRMMILFLGLFLGRVLFIFWQPKASLRLQMSLVMGAVILTLAISVGWWTDAVLFTGLIMAPFYPLMMTALGRLFPDRIGENASLCNVVQGLALVSMHGIVGWITDLAGISMAMAFGIMLSFVTFLMLLSYPWVFRRPFG